MSDAERQKRFRQRKRKDGMVDIRLDIPISLRDKLKGVAEARGTTMKEVIRTQLEQITISQFLS